MSGLAEVRVEVAGAEGSSVGMHVRRAGQRRIGASIFRAVSSATLALAGLLAGPIAGGAAAELLTQAEISETISGATINLDTPLGTVLPVSFAPDGTMSGHAGSTLGFFLGAEADSGRWWIAEGRLCKKWTKWFRAKANCVTLQREGAKLYWTRPDGESGTATIAVPAPSVAQLKKSASVSRPPVPAAAAATATHAAPAPSAPTRAYTASLAPIAPAPRRSHVIAAAASPIALPIPKPVPAPRQAASAAARSQNSISGPRYRVANVAIDDVLNMRTGPSHLSPVKGTLPPDAAGLRIVGACERGWCIVRYRALTGWVNSYYLAPADTRSDRDRS